MLYLVEVIRSSRRLIRPKYLGHTKIQSTVCPNHDRSDREFLTGTRSCVPTAHPGKRPLAPRITTRNYQRLGNRLIRGHATAVDYNGIEQRRRRLGGMLNSYYRKAA